MLGAAGRRRRGNAGVRPGPRLLREALRARRNQPGGYWVAKDDPRAAEEAVTGSRSLADLNGVALLSNGASRIVSPYGLTDWPGVLDLLGSAGRPTSSRRVRQAEARTTGDVDAHSPTTPQWPTARTCHVEHCPEVPMTPSVDPCRERMLGFTRETGELRQGLGRPTPPARC